MEESKILKAMTELALEEEGRKKLVDFVQEDINKYTIQYKDSEERL